MNRNRLIQSLSIVVAVACLVGAGALVPTISQQRAAALDHDVSAAKHSLTAAMLGSFRGLAVDALWYRAEMLKREGKFFDAKTLRDWIVTLQPRFPEVWRYQAWDMAYNISVATHTPEERWDWVNKGVRLLREEGIPNNPRAVPLYRELAWIFFHKIGGNSDDMHWVYKARLAQEWQELLGVPAEGAPTDQVVAQFRPIAEAAQRYFLFDAPTLRARETIQAIAADVTDADLRSDLLGLLDRNLVRFAEGLEELVARIRPTNRELAQRLEPVLENTRTHLERAARDPLSLLLQDAPDVRPLVEQLAALGHEPGVMTLRRIGQLQMLLRYSETFVRTQLIPQMPPEGQALAQLVLDPEWADEFRTLQNFMRARALVQEYHMNPVVMYGLMDEFGPIDWRHPAAHALYWAYLGVERSGELQDRNKYDVLNTDRTVIHALQALFRQGRLTYNPLTGQVDMLPDPRFVDEYPEAMQAAIGRQEDAWQGDGTVESFEAGHENFLLSAVVFHYLYGEVDKAREYYDRVREQYGQEGHNLQSGRYTLPLQDFVVQELQQDWGMRDVARQFIQAMLQNAFTHGLGNGRMEVFNRYVELAQVMHEQYQRERASATGYTERDRMTLLDFDEVLTEAYAEFMRYPAFDFIEKVRVYRNTPAELQAAAYPLFRAAAAEQAQAAGYDPASAFPPPPGFEVPAPAAAATQEPQGQAPGQTIERK